MDAEHLVVIGDARNMRELPASSVQLIVTSPPNLNFRLAGPEGNGYLNDFESYLKGLMGVFSECKRVLEPGRFLCINLSDSASNIEKMPIPAHIIFAVRRSGFRFCEDVFWSRTAKNTAISGRQTTLFDNKAHLSDDFQIQRTLIFSKGLPRKSRRLKGECGMDSHGAAVFCRNGPVRYLQDLDARSPMPNPDIFPEEMVESLILHFSDEGDIILDPFLGDGMLPKVASHLNRRSAGYESNPYNMRIIRQKAGIPDGHLKIIFQGEGRLT